MSNISKEEQARLAQALLSSKQNGTTEELLASEEYSEYQFGSHADIAYTAAPVDDDAHEKISKAVKDLEQPEHRQPFIHIGVLNHSVGVDGLWAHVAVVDKDGIPKQIESITAQSDTSIQKFDPEEGDSLLEFIEGTESVTVRTMKQSDAPLEMSDVVDAEYQAVVEEFLRAGTESRYFIIQGHNEVINGLALNDAFKRRHHLAELLDGVEPSVSDSLANWIDRSDQIDVMNLNWDHASALSDASIDLSIQYSLVGGNTALQTTQAIVWRLIGGKPIGELIQININPASYLAGAKDAYLSIQRTMVLDEHVFKAMVITQVDDKPMHIKLYHNEGTPWNAIPDVVYDANYAPHRQAFEYLGCKSVYEGSEEEDAPMINDSYFKCDHRFNLGAIEHMYECNYKTTWYMYQSEMIEVDLTSEYDVEHLPTDFYGLPMYHVFNPIDTVSKKLVCVVNLPVKAFTTTNKEEEDNGTITQQQD